MARSILVSLMNQVLNAQAGTEREMVFFAKSQHACNRLAAPFALFIGKRDRPNASRFESSFEDFLRRAANTAGERGFQQLLAAR